MVNSNRKNEADRLQRFATKTTAEERSFCLFCISKIVGSSITMYIMYQLQFSFGYDKSVSFPRGTAHCILYYIEKSPLNIFEEEKNCSK